MDSCILFCIDPPLVTYLTAKALVSEDGNLVSSWVLKKTQLAMTLKIVQTDSHGIVVLVIR